MSLKNSQMIQIGAINTGWGLADGAISDLRISRTARYTKDFTPSTKPFKVDRQTTVLLPFNGSLNGMGMTNAGSKYTFTATAGIATTP